MNQFWSQNGYISKLVNSIPEIEKKSYLELGIGTGINFGCVRCNEKVSVDLRRDLNPTFAMSTDDFFRQNNQRFDIVYIDADHSFTQVIKDFKNTLEVCNEYIFLHDLVPPGPELTSPAKCGNAYKLLYYLVKEEGLTIYTIDMDCGLSFIQMPVQVDTRRLLLNLEYPLQLDYSDFMNWLDQNHTRYSLEKMVSILSKEI